MREITRLTNACPALAPLGQTLQKALDALVSAARQGGKILICGNGGSAADAEHIVGELMKNFCLKRPVDPVSAKKIRQAEGGEALLAGLQGAIPAISLGSHTALMTALCNDGDPNMAYAQQVYGYGTEKDVLIALSTSGNAQNVVNAARVARALGLCVISLTGQNGGALKDCSDICLCLPESETYKIQELTLPIYHALCLGLEQAVFG